MLPMFTNRYVITAKNTVASPLQIQTLYGPAIAPITTVTSNTSANEKCSATQGVRKRGLSCEKNFGSVPSRPCAKITRPSAAMPARYVPVDAVIPVIVTMTSQRCQKIAAIGVIGVKPELASLATWAGGIAMLKAQEHTIQNTPTISNEATVATGTRERGVFVSSATVLTTSKPVKDRMPKSTPRKIALAPPVAADGLSGAAVRCPSVPRTMKIVAVSARIVTISKHMNTSAVLADTVTSRYTAGATTAVTNSTPRMYVQVEDVKPRYCTNSLKNSPKMIGCRN